jgi:hypothetical protein
VAIRHINNIDEDKKVIKASKAIEVAAIIGLSWFAIGIWNSCINMYRDHSQNESPVSSYLEETNRLVEESKKVRKESAEADAKRAARTEADRASLKMHEETEHSLRDRSIRIGTISKTDYNTHKNANVEKEIRKPMKFSGELNMEIAPGLIPASDIELNTKPVKKRVDPFLDIVEEKVNMPASDTGLGVSSVMKRAMLKDKERVNIPASAAGLGASSVMKRVDPFAEVMQYQNTPKTRHR